MKYNISYKIKTRPKICYLINNKIYNRFIILLFPILRTSVHRQTTDAAFSVSPSITLTLPCFKINKLKTINAPCVVLRFVLGVIISKACAFFCHLTVFKVIFAYWNRTKELLKVCSRDRLVTTNNSPNLEQFQITNKYTLVSFVISLRHFTMAR